MGTSSLAPSALVSEAPSVDAGDPLLGGIVDQEPRSQSDDDNLGFALGISLAAVALLLLLGFLVSRRQIAQTRNLRMSDEGMYGAAATAYGAGVDVRRIYGTGDPPHSFHEGLYHYMADGTRYLSTNCAICMETRLNSFYTDDNLGTIPEDQEYEDVMFGSSVNYFDPEADEEMQPSSYLRNLVNGRIIAAPDVHVCNSALCRCAKLKQPNSPNQHTTFLDNSSAFFCRDVNSAEAMDSLLTLGDNDRTSSRKGEQEV